MVKSESSLQQGNSVYTRLFLITFCLVCFSAFAQQTTVVRYNFVHGDLDPVQDYYVEVLQAALAVTADEFGAFTLVAENIPMEQGRASQLLAQNKYIDVHWQMTSLENESLLKAIHVPVLGGLMGLRIFAIRAGEQYRFPPNMTWQALQAMTAGQGHDWPDTAILIHNQFKVVGSKAESMYGMLKRERFDYYPRAIHEIEVEINSHPTLAVEQNLMFQYVAPLYFFVNKDNHFLYKRLTLGMERLASQGILKQKLLAHPVFGNVINQVKQQSRQVFHLVNPALSAKTEAIINDPHYWLFPFTNNALK